jgi:hypothetical protein
LHVESLWPAVVAVVDLMQKAVLEVVCKEHQEQATAAI